MTLVLVIVEAAAELLQAVALVVAVGLENIAGLNEDSANVRVHALEPLAKLIVLLSILVEVVHGIADDAQRRAVGEPLKERAQLTDGLIEGAVGSQLLTGILGVVGDVTTVRRVLLEVVEQPTNRLLVILVLLALDDDLNKMGELRISGRMKP